MIEQHDESESTSGAPVDADLAPPALYALDDDVAIERVDLVPLAGATS